MKRFLSPLIMTLVACVSAPLLGWGSAINVSLAPKDNVIWVSVVRRVGTDYLVVSYEDSWNETGKRFLNVRAQSAKGRCDANPGQEIALVTYGAGTRPRSGSLIFRGPFGQQECRAVSIVPFEG